MASSFVSLAEATAVNIVNDEKFEKVYGVYENAIRIVEDGRTCETIRPGLWSLGCALGHHSYSSSIHQIRIMKQYGMVVIGIRSRNMPFLPDLSSYGRYDENPSIHCWCSYGGRVRNGRYESAKLTDYHENKCVFTLTLNCDERRLSIVNEDNHEQDEMNVYESLAPFPWCLFVQISRMGGRVSLL
ncbi:unnamed protein product [Adineta ricciae]|uniref:Uncharacterized protein n=1 Tax=Adineta ricciae TaxID=249248 RepID=A0A816EW72_ADIRI|nr:unnamed protein product [Adineta ricciae]CAF1651721.1 unnamed protein product [Adineta ricciae]